MPDNLIVTIGANAAPLRAQLALAQSEMRSATRSLNSLATTARLTGSELALTKLGEGVSRLETAEARLSTLINREWKRPPARRGRCRRR